MHDFCVRLHTERHTERMTVKPDRVTSASVEVLQFYLSARDLYLYCRVQVLRLWDCSRSSTTFLVGWNRRWSASRSTTGVKRSTT